MTTVDKICRHFDTIAQMDAIAVGNILREHDAEQQRKIEGLRADLASDCVAEPRRLREKLAEQQAEIDRLEKLCREFVPRPERMSGYTDPDCPAEYQSAIRLACEYHGVPVPAHVQPERR